MTQELIEAESKLEQDIQLTLGDQNYYLTVTLPSLICELSQLILLFLISCQKQS